MSIGFALVIVFCGSFANSKSSRIKVIARYAILLTFVLLQEPLDGQGSSAARWTQSLNHTLMAAYFILIFSPVFEISLVSVPLIIINNRVRIHHIEQDPSDDPITWYEHLVYSLILFLILLLFIIHQCRTDKS